MPLIPSLEIEAWSNNVRLCSACTARTEAESPVPGYGDKTGILFLGKNPGGNEDRTGYPFQGKSGVIFNDFLADCGLTRADAFIGNLINCHTEGDRDPTRLEAATCARLHLAPLVDILEPYLVVTMGAPAAKYILGVDTKTGGLVKRHGNVIPARIGQTRFWAIPCYHPGSILRDERYQDKLDYDAVQIRRFLQHKEEFIERLRGEGRNV